jgi:hypothetical protein
MLQVSPHKDFSKVVEIVKKAMLAYQAKTYKAPTGPLPQHLKSSSMKVDPRHHPHQHKPAAVCEVYKKAPCFCMFNCIKREIHCFAHADVFHRVCANSYSVEVMSICDRCKLLFSVLNYV